MSPMHNRPAVPNLSCLHFLLLLSSSFFFSLSNSYIPPPVPLPSGTTDEVYNLLERILPTSSQHFLLQLTEPTTDEEIIPSFTLSDTVRNSSQFLLVEGTSASELASGIGYYLREYCNMSIGWLRGGGTNVFLPSSWPRIGTNTITKQRSVPYSFAMNVCTLSYTMVWHSWSQWEYFLDWAALSGLNIMLGGLTGQEEVQYKVFQTLGLDDLSIRTWFNGPAFLAWSRGQNSHGSDLSGPLPRSWMHQQLLLNQQIVQRARNLGMVPVLPAFQGVVPWELIVLYNDTLNASRTDATGWLDARDPLFGKIADIWMSIMCNDFNCTDHVYQMDGFFHNTSGWGKNREESRTLASIETNTVNDYSSPSCVWSDPLPDTYLAGCVQNCQVFPTVEEAQVACLRNVSCGGITIERGQIQLRAGRTPITYPNETSYVITNSLQCQVLPPDPTWTAIGNAAYQGISRTDPEAVWMYQGWALYVANTGLNTRDPLALSRFRGFINAPPPGKFLIVDMASNGAGEWLEWENTWNTSFIWTSLHTFGGSDSLKGNLSLANRIPYDAFPSSVNNISIQTVTGVGFTPEGFDQNPVYYELLQEAAYRTSPVENITLWLIERAHRRYGLEINPENNVSKAWFLLGNSSYSNDESVTDTTGVGIIPGTDLSHFLPDLYTPSDSLCQVYNAWNLLIDISLSSTVNVSLPTFRYDLINTGREILAQLSTPLSVNFSNAVRAKVLDPVVINRTATAYATLLLDLDYLLSTETGFLLGPWLMDARSWGINGTDCTNTIRGNLSCPDFMEWNARVQLTTWYPTPSNATEVYPRDTDYARKHWNGLVKDYYAYRVTNVYQQQALEDAAKNQPLNVTALAQREATLAYTWTTSTVPYPLVPTPNYPGVTQTIRDKYAEYFRSCTGVS